MRTLPAHLLFLASLAALPPLTAQDRHPQGQEHGHDHGATVRHRFDDVERWVRRFDDPQRDAWQKPRQVLGFLEVGEGQTVADLGAGTGYFTVHLAAAVGEGGRVWAVDIEPSLVRHIAERCEEAGLQNVEAVLAEPDDPKLPKASLDLVLIVDTWHHIDDRLRYLDRLAATLRPGGRVAIVDFHDHELPVGPPPGHKLSREAVVAELGEAGWRLEREGDLLPHQYLLVFEPPRG